MQNPSSSSKRLAQRRNPSLTHDLILEILIRLPAKSIGRVRCVCRRWLSETTHPDFIRTHAARVQASGFFIFPTIMRNQTSPEYFPFESDDFDSCLLDPNLSFLNHAGHPPKLLDSCNGLILCCQPNKFRLLAVCNPLTRAYHVIPAPPNQSSHWCHSCKIVFDPSKSPHFKIASYPLDKHGSICIYSSDSCKWKKIPTIGYYCLFFTVLWKGNPVWLLSGRRLLSDHKLLSLDMQTEQLKWLPSPRTTTKERYRYLGESGSSLHYIREQMPITHQSILNFDILELRHDSSSWSILYRVHLDVIMGVYPEVKRSRKGHFKGDLVLGLAIEVVRFVRGEHGVGDRLILSIPGKIVCCHLRDMSFKTICSNVPPAVYRNDVVYSFKYFYHHAHTLISLESPAHLHNDWICWTRERDKLLITLMVNKSMDGQESASDFGADTWRKITKKFNMKTELHCDVCHLKQRLKSYRRDYRIVNEMISCEGFSWDPKLQMVIPEDAKWSEHLKGKNKKSILALYMRRQVPFKDLDIIFASHTSSCQGTLNCNTESTSVGTQRNVDYVNTDIAVTGDVTIQQDDDVEDVPEAENTRGAETTKLMLFDSCLEGLNGLEDINDELYVKALFILKEEQNQHIFLKTNGARRVLWLKAATKHVNLD